jgi:putative ABC transport system permease protein
VKTNVYQIWISLLNRPVRSVVSIVAIGIEVAMMLSFVGITSGILQDFGRRVQGVGADAIIQPPNASLLLSLGGASMPIKIRDKILELKQVKQAAPVLVALDTEKGFDMIYGVDFTSFSGLGRGFRFVSGALPRSANEVLIDDFKSRSQGMKVGSRVRLLGHDFTVSGIVEHGRGARFFLPISALQEITGSGDKVTLFFVESRGDVPALLAELKQIFAGYKILAVDEYATLMSTTNFSEIQLSLRIIVFLAALIGFLIILMTMYTSVMDRITEIGVRRVVGAKRRDIMRQMLTEACALVLLGYLLGIGTTYLLKTSLAISKPTLSILIRPDWVAKSGLIALASALLGATYPAYHASRIDPVRAVAYE